MYFKETREYNVKCHTLIVEIHNKKYTSFFFTKDNYLMIFSDKHLYIIKNVLFTIS